MHSRSWAATKVGAFFTHVSIIYCYGEIIYNRTAFKTDTPKSWHCFVKTSRKLMLFSFIRLLHVSMKKKMEETL